MTIRTGVYIVPTHRWYIERTVWLIAGIVLLASTTLALFLDRRWILGVIATGVVSIQVSLTGFCPVGNVLRLFGFTPMLGERTPRRWNLYFMQTDRWYLERRIYLAVGINISVASVLVLTHSPWWAAFTMFVGAAMVWFAATGYCIMANGLYWIGAEPRLNPDSLPSGRCAECGISNVCIGEHAKRIDPPLPLVAVSGVTTQESHSRSRLGPAPGPHRWAAPGGARKLRIHSSAVHPLSAAADEDSETIRR